MTKKEANDSVQDEQFGKTEDTDDNEQQDSDDQEEKEDVADVTSSPETPDRDDPEPEPESGKNDKTNGDEAVDTGDEAKDAKEKPGKSEEDGTQPSHEKDDIQSDNVTDLGKVNDPVEKSAEDEDSVKDSEHSDEEVESDNSTDNEQGTDSRKSDDADQIEVTEKDGKEDADEVTDTSEPTPPKYKPEKIDYTKLSKEDLVKVLKDLIDMGAVTDIRKDVEAIKSNFYKKNKAEIEEIRKHFLAEGGQMQDFKVEESPVETELKELLAKYRELRQDLNRKLEDEKEENLKEKYNIIEGIKELINSQESLNKTFHDFRELQNRWRDIGPVPQANLKDLWESYHYHVEAFYDYIKINKELRDLDFKKNLEAKIRLCELAEELLLEPSVVEAFRKLQKLHDQWREIGPVPIEKRSELWERFKEATTKINRKHQEYFVNLKQEQKKNYEEKIILCEKAEEIARLDIEDHTEWEEKSRELIELQKVWKSIGFAPKKYNTQVYERFRKACDAFFDKKREHYSQNREEQQNNLQLKTELCIQAEGLQDSTDWKKTTNDLIALQKKWKSIGPVPQKQSEKIWKRFRAACDAFFDRKSEFYSKIDTHYEENLEKKKKLIEKIEKFKLTSDVEKNLGALKEFQREWSEIGYVPLKEKNEIQEQYRLAINAKFDLLKVDENKKALLKYRSRLEGIAGKPNAQNRFRMERDKCFNKLKQLENDIVLWENNIGFFADSDNAEAMINDVNHKIESAKTKIEQLKGKIRMLDEFED